MTQLNEENHTFADKLNKDNAFKIETESILFDLIYLLKDYYNATFFENKDCLQVFFSNDQHFDIIVKEVI